MLPGLLLSLESGSQDLANLLNMIYIVTRHVAGEVCDRNLSALGVHSEPLPLFRREESQHPQVGFAQQAEQLQRLRGFARLVIPKARPQVLVERIQGDSIVLDHLAIAPIARHFVLCEMRENFSDRPFARRRAARELRFRSTADQIGEDCESLPLSDEKIRVLTKSANTLKILRSVRHGRTVYRECEKRRAATSAAAKESDTIPAACIPTKPVDLELQRQSVDLSGNARLIATVIAAVAWFALALQLYLIIGVTVADGGSALMALVNYLSFFTILTNLLVALALSFALWGGQSKVAMFSRRSDVLSAVAAYIAIVGITYSLLLRHVWNPEGLQKLADVLLHDAIPLAFVLFWFVFVPKRSLRWSDPIRWLAYPLVYLVYVLLRGVLLPHYPYYFIDVRALGLSTVLLNSALLVSAFLAVGFVMVGIGRWSGRPRRA
jgi:hypothetical protein